MSGASSPDDANELAVRAIEHTDEWPNATVHIHGCSKPLCVLQNLSKMVSFVSCFADSKFRGKYRDLSMTFNVVLLSDLIWISSIMNLVTLLFQLIVPTFPFAPAIFFFSPACIDSLSCFLSRPHSPLRSLARLGFVSLYPYLCLAQGLFKPPLPFSPV